MTTEGGRNSPPPPITWTIPYASARWGVSETTGRDLARRGLFPGAFRVPGTRRWLVHVATFEEEVARLARRERLCSDSDEVLMRAIGDVRIRANGGIDPRLPRSPSRNTRI